MIRQILIILFLLMTHTAMAIEEPRYTVIEKSGKLELRHYSPKIIAETVVAGSMDKASSAGFRLIADFIFGNNTASDGASNKISMTAPVIIEPRSEKISMTAPATLKESAGQWRVEFVMPNQFTMRTLPTPNDKRVTIREVPAANYAVIRFSGLAREKKVATKTTELLQWLNGKSITPVSTPELARYNPPWTPPFLRRNEVLIQY